MKKKYKIITGVAIIVVTALAFSGWSIRESTVRECRENPIDGVSCDCIERHEFGVSCFS